MNADDRIIEEFDRLYKTERDKLASLPFADQMVYLVIVARCQKDMGGFETVFEQGLSLTEINLLVTGFQRMNETELAKYFTRIAELLEQCGFYGRNQRDFARVPKKGETGNRGNRRPDWRSTLGY